MTITKGKLRVACDHCVKQKRRCVDGSMTTPCDACKDKGIPCHFSMKRRKPRPAKVEVPASRKKARVDRMDAQKANGVASTVDKKDGAPPPKAALQKAPRGAPEYEVVGMYPRHSTEPATTATTTITTAQDTAKVQANLSQQVKQKGVQAAAEGGLVVTAGCPVHSPSQLGTKVPLDTKCCCTRWVQDQAGATLLQRQQPPALAAPQPVRVPLVTSSGHLSAPSATRILVANNVSTEESSGYQTDDENDKFYLSSPQATQPKPRPRACSCSSGSSYGNEGLEEMLRSSSAQSSPYSNLLAWEPYPFKVSMPSTAPFGGTFSNKPELVPTTFGSPSAVKIEDKEKENSTSSLLKNGRGNSSGNGFQSAGDSMWESTGMLLKLGPEDLTRQESLQ
ncbi:unnamed protein product, partial [Chrysoparadoxa australica]